MSKELIDKLRKFLIDNQAQYLLVNSTNEFLVEYNQLDDNSRYHLTGFSGSTGDALLSLSKIFQFVDGRYHEQADLEVDKRFVEVVKLQMGVPYINELASKIKDNSRVIIVGSKVSNSFLAALESEFEVRNISTTLIDFDPVQEAIDVGYKKRKQTTFSVPDKISGVSADKKAEKLIQSMPRNSVAIVTSIEDIAYLTNTRSYDIPYSSSFFAKALVSTCGVKLFTDAKIGSIGSSFEVFPYSEFQNRLENIKNSTVYLDETSISADDFFMVHDSNELAASKLYIEKTLKNDSEINHMKSAFKRADEALQIVSDMLKSNNRYSELDICNELSKNFYDCGAQSLSFKPIVAAGKNSSIIHYSHPKNSVYVNDGDFLLVDCGGYYEGGYATDITRTFLKGNPSDMQKKVYTTVLKAHISAYTGLYTKTSTWFDIDNNARQVIDNAGLEDFSFGHSTGHGVGISVHEAPPFVGPSVHSKKPIFEKAVFTIEPGIYKPNWGGVRLENTVYIDNISEKANIKNLSAFKFDTNIVDYTMLTPTEKLWLEEWQEQ